MNEPGGSVTCALPTRTTGGLRMMTSSPWRVSRARLCFSASFDRDVSSAVPSGPDPRTSTSSPLSAAVI